jgi:hypothetical protein
MRTRSIGDPSARPGPPFLGCRSLPQPNGVVALDSRAQNSFDPESARAFVARNCSEDVALGVSVRRWETVPDKDDSQRVLDGRERLRPETVQGVATEADRTFKRAICPIMGRSVNSRTPVSRGATGPAGPCRDGVPVRIVSPAANEELGLLSFRWWLGAGVSGTRWLGRC